jgi:hypothetical protein
MTNIFKAWCAGFFDGEGCVMITRRKRSNNFIEHFVAAVIGQKDIRPLQEIQKKFGGVLTKRTTSNCFQWRAHGGTAERFYKTIRPFLVLKGEETDYALEIRKTAGKPGFRLREGVWQKREDIWIKFRTIRDSKCTTS